MFDKNYYQKKLNDEYQKFGKRKDTLLNDAFSLFDRGREDLQGLVKSIQELELAVKENEKKVVEETKEEKPVEVKK